MPSIGIPLGPVSYSCALAAGAFDKKRARAFEKGVMASIPLRAVIDVEALYSARLREAPIELIAGVGVKRGRELRRHDIKQVGDIMGFFDPTVLHGQGLKAGTVAAIGGAQNKMTSCRPV